MVNQKLANWERADLAKAYRLKLLATGYIPLPVTGKIPAMAGWQNGIPDADEIQQWTKGCPTAWNTGITTALTPTLDIDILNEEAAVAVEDLARDRFAERGYVLTRIGLPPKRAILFRTDKPFDKITVNLIAGNGEMHRIEFLGAGQQIVIDGLHPDTQEPYRWHGGTPGEIEQEALPYITAEEAKQLVDDAAEMLVRDFGYKLPNKSNGATPHGGEVAKADNDRLLQPAIRERQYAKAALNGCAAELANTPDGSRNDTLNAKAFRIGTMVGSGWISRNTAYDDLLGAALASGLDETEAHATLKSGLTAGEKVPHADLPDDGEAGHSTDARHGDHEHHDQHQDHDGTEHASQEGQQQADPQPEVASTTEGKAFGYSWKWAWHGQVDPIEDRKHLIKGLLPEIGAALISGQWGTYKTFVADNLATSVMTGEPFINFPVTRKGGVLFFACEGQSEVAIRLTAAFEAKGGPGKAPFAWVENCPRLLDPNASEIITAMVKQAAERMQAEFGLPVALVIVDTAGKAAGLTKTGELNDDAIAKMIMKAMGDASRETGALCVGVAHFGKNIETGTKGSTGFEDDADVVLALLGQRGVNGRVDNPRMCVRKRRSGANGQEFAFRTVVVSMGVDQDGEEVTTLRIEWLPTGEDEAMTAGRAKKPGDAWGAKSLRLLRQTLMNMLADCGAEKRPYPDGPAVRAVDIETVRAEFYKSYPTTGDAKTKAGVRRKAFNRALADAQAKGLVGSRDIGTITYLWLTTPTESA